MVFWVLPDKSPSFSMGDTSQYNLTLVESCHLIMILGSSILFLVFKVAKRSKDYPSNSDDSGNTIVPLHSEDTSTNTDH